MPARAVLIDLYDTLVWTDWERVRRALASRLGLDGELIARAFRETRAARNVGAYGDAAGDWDAVLAWAGVEAPPEVAVDAASLEHELLREAVRPFPESMPVVQELRGRGVKTALISNCSFATRPVVDRLGLPDAFDAVILSFEVGVRKPDPGIYEMALASLGDVVAGDALFVDDQPGYCDGAATLGIGTFLMHRGHETPDEPGGDHHAELTDLRQLFHHV